MNDVELKIKNSNFKFQEIVDIFQTRYYTSVNFLPRTPFRI